tara:strand:+ start:362 stop:739 length:378 start_codon:yes stop_codon:yes gene_type:complete
LSFFTDGYIQYKLTHSIRLVAAKSLNLELEIQPVNEDGASVWSASIAAKTEFPNPPSVAVLGAVSIGRRLQDPMNVLVSIPPKSLGLGMYQHDLNETEVRERKWLQTATNIHHLQTNPLTALQHP